MEPLNDQELDSLLDQYEPPSSPSWLEEKLFRKQRFGFWVLSGTISVPVPLAMLIIAILITLSTAMISSHKRSVTETEVRLADFKPADHIRVQIIRGIR